MDKKRNNRFRERKYFEYNIIVGEYNEILALLKGDQFKIKENIRKTKSFVSFQRVSTELV